MHCISGEILAMSL